jgi:hypothetical protein
MPGRTRSRTAPARRLVPRVAVADVAQANSIEPWIEESHQSRKEWLQASNPSQAVSSMAMSVCRRSPFPHDVRPLTDTIHLPIHTITSLLHPITTVLFEGPFSFHSSPCLPQLGSRILCPFLLGFKWTTGFR